MDYEDKVYKCLLVNDTEEVVEFYPSLKPGNRIKLEPGQKYNWESQEEREVFSQFNKVTWGFKYSASGKEKIVKCYKRKNFKIKYNETEFPVLWLNQGDNLFEIDRCSSGSYVLQFGVPTVVTYHGYETRAIFSSITIQMPELVKKPSIFQPGLLRVTKKTNWKYVKKSPKQLLKVKIMREKMRRNEIEGLNERGVKLDTDLD